MGAGFRGTRPAFFGSGAGKNFLLTLFRRPGHIGPKLSHSIKSLTSSSVRTGRPPGGPARHVIMQFGHYRYAATVTILLAAALIAIGFLLVDNGRLRQMLRDPAAFVAAQQTGSEVPPLQAADVTGGICRLSYGPGEPATLLCWLTMRSSRGKDNIPFWNELAHRFAGRNVRVIGMCTGEPDEVRGYAAAQGVAFPVIAAGDPYIVEAYGGTVVPQTLLISPTGQVAGRWPGVAGSTQQAEIEARAAEAGKLEQKTPETPENAIP